MSGLICINSGDCILNCNMMIDYKIEEVNNMTVTDFLKD